jgi:two-component system, sensor histidine kinase and response regulator
MKRIGIQTVGLKNRALIIISLLIISLTVIFLLNILKYKNRETHQLASMYKSLIVKLYTVAKNHVDHYYSSAMSEMSAMEEFQKAAAIMNRQQLNDLTDAFFKARNVRFVLLKEIVWYRQLPGTETIERHRIHRMKNDSPAKKKNLPNNPLLNDILKKNLHANQAFCQNRNLVYRMITAVNPEDETKHGEGIKMALEFLVEPRGFIEEEKGLLDMKSVILLKAGADVDKNADYSKMLKINWGGELYFIDASAHPDIQELPQMLGQLNREKDFSEVTCGDATYLLHHTIRFETADKQVVARVVSIQEISEEKVRILSFNIRIVAVTLAILVIVLITLFMTFGKLMNKLIARDEQLEETNKRLGEEIVEREAIQRELQTHRDHLEDLITEGTRELEIKSQEIEVNEEKLRSITFSLQDAIVMMEPKNGISFWNPAAERIFGYTYDEVEGEDFFRMMIPNSDWQNFRQTFEAVLSYHGKDDYGKVLEIECKRKSGEPFPVEMTISEVDFDGKLNIIILIRDVTRRKKEEMEKRILLRAVEQSSVAIQIADTSGIITYVNPRFCEITGYSREEVIGQNTNILKSNFNPEEEYKDLWETVAAGKDWQGELYNRKKNGDLYWDSTLISPIKDSQGNITHFVAIKDDVTERKNMEVELLTAKESAEAASRSKGEFLANMSHEIRTPMNAIIGMTELTLGTELTREQLEYLEIVQQASRSLLKLLNDILDFSKVDAGKMILEPQPFSLRKIIGETAKTLSIEAHKKDLEMIYHIDSEVPDQLLGDAGRLRQIIVNLIGNGIKFTEEGEIVLRIEVLEEGLENKILIHFVVSDTGIGIPEDHMVTIFEQFSQADSSTTRKYGGSGLGLAISSKLVELMDGVIWVESPATFPHINNSGPGSTFHFTGLFELDHSTVEELPSADVTKLKDLPLLVVDDNETNRRFLQEVLERHGLRPEVAGSGQEALDMLTAQPESQSRYRLVILDYRMPEMDGYTVLKRMRSELNLQIPVILLTSGIRVEQLVELKKQVSTRHLLKPINSQELIDAILETMGYKGEPLKVNDSAIEIEKRPPMKIRILVAEDNGINQRLIKRLLEQKEHVVKIVGNGKEAVEEFREKRDIPGQNFQMVLMDIQMPVMDGIEATRRIRKLEKNVPIIALTAHAMKGDKGKFLSKGMDDYVSKPIDSALLFQTLEKYFPKES